MLNLPEDSKIGNMRILHEGNLHNILNTKRWYLPQMGSSTEPSCVHLADIQLVKYLDLNITFLLNFIKNAYNFEIFDICSIVINTDTDISNPTLKMDSAKGLFKSYSFHYVIKNNILSLYFRYRLIYTQVKIYSLNNYIANNLAFDDNSNKMFEQILIDSSTINNLTEFNYMKKMGGTTERPSQNNFIGNYFFDTTLSKPIWYNGTNWIDSTGTVV